MKVVICTLTYLRPVGLRRLLDGLAAMRRPDDVELVAVVIDNDADRTARAVVAAFEPAPPLDVRYEVEPTRGITHARNRALAVAGELGADWIVWLDDDEVPAVDWLERVVATQRRTDADVVSTPARPRFDADAPSWIIDTGAFEAPTFEGPMPYFHARTSAVMMRASIAPAEGFDNRLALVGGEDRMFFTRIHRAGGTFVWDDAAFVDEWVPASRTSAGWLVRRWFRIGVSRSLVMLYLDEPAWPRRLRRVAGGLVMALRGLAETIIATRHGRSAAFAASRRMLLGVGASYGALGLTFQEYRRIHGR